MNCRECIHHRGIAGNAHISCNHTAVEGMGVLLAFWQATATYKGPILDFFHNPLPLGIVLNEHGVRNGWAYWPFDFDPIWVEKCEGYQKGE